MMLRNVDVFISYRFITTPGCVPNDRALRARVVQFAGDECTFGTDLVTHKVWEFERVKNLVAKKMHGKTVTVTFLFDPLIAREPEVVCVSTPPDIGQYYRSA